jgi:hypothetical protein
LAGWLLAHKLQDASRQKCLYARRTSSLVHNRKLFYSKLLLHAYLMTLFQHQTLNSVKWDGNMNGEYVMTTILPVMKGRRSKLVLKRHDFDLKV